MNNYETRGRRLLLFGGTFDPIHWGHLIIADAVREELGVDRVIFVPARVPPHKLEKDITSAGHRLKMLDIAIRDYGEFSISDIELSRSGASYSIDTVEYFLGLGCKELYLLIGEDNAIELTTWKEYEKLIDIATIVIVGRPGSGDIDITDEIKERSIYIKTPQIEISSTDIRRRVRGEHSIRMLTPKEVVEYIHHNDLYK